MTALRQALHIFRKDIRYLRYEAAFFLAITILLVANVTEWVQILRLVAGCYLIARLIHGETIPGDNQFWVTRPYRWESLLGAKLLFILVVVILPAGIAQLYLVLSKGFALSDVWAGWLWFLLLLLFCVALPVAAIASITSGIIPMMLAALVLVALAFAGMPLLFLHGLGTISLGPTEWVRDFLCFVILTVAVCSVLYMQYRHRWTIRSRLFAIVGLFLLITTYLYTPGAFTFAVQAHLSRQAFDGSQLQMALVDQPHKTVIGDTRSPNIPLRVPIEVQGIPAGLISQIDAMVITFEAPDRRTSTSPPLTLAVLGTSAPDSQTVLFPVTVLMGSAFFMAEKWQPITLHATLYFTLFGNRIDRTIPFGPRVDVMEGLQCARSGPMEREVTCSVAFRWPAGKLFAQFQSGELNSFTELISYSPFPGSLGLNPIEIHRASAYSRERLDSKPLVTIVSYQPLAYFRHDIELRAATLESLAAR